MAPVPPPPLELPIFYSDFNPWSPLGDALDLIGFVKFQQGPPHYGTEPPGGWGQ